MIKKKRTNTVQFLWEGIVPSLNSLFPFPSLAPSSAGNKNKNHRVFIDSQRKRVVAGEEENRRFLFFFLELRAFCRALALERLLRSPMFSKRTKRKIKQRLCTG